MGRMGCDGIGLNIGIVCTALVYTVCIRSLYSAAVATKQLLLLGITDNRPTLGHFLLSRHSLTLLLYDEQLSDRGEILHNESLTVHLSVSSAPHHPQIHPRWKLPVSKELLSLTSKPPKSFTGNSTTSPYSLNELKVFTYTRKELVEK
jgi:hypothetical protein